METKVCKNLDEEKELNEFIKTREDLLKKKHPYKKEYYQENKERIKETQKKWRAKNPDKCKKISKTYYEKNKEKINEDAKKWQEENKERFTEMQKEWRKNNSKQYAAMVRKSQEKNKVPAIYKITCIKNDRIYIGSSRNFNQRKVQWKSDLKKDRNAQMKNDYHAYGFDAFKFEILEEGEHLANKEVRKSKEGYYQDVYEALEKGYNVYPVGKK